VAEVADAVEVLARLDPRSLHDVLVQGEARARRADGKSTANLSGPGDRGDVPFGEAPEVELPPGGSGQTASCSLGSQRQQVLLLGRDELRRVDLEEGLPLLDRVAGLVDVDPFHPAGEAKVDGRSPMARTWRKTVWRRAGSIRAPMFWTTIGSMETAPDADSRGAWSS
jgi:hypothetical protein